MKKLLLLLFMFTKLTLGQAHKKTAALPIVQDNPSDSLCVFDTMVATPEHLGMSSKKLVEIDSIVNSAISQKVFPGCQVLVVKDGKFVYDKSFGTFTYDSSQIVTSSTLYDLASLSKTTGTLLAIMKLYDEGKLKLTDKASTYLPFLRATNKEDITILELLVHESGLPAGLPFSDLILEKKDAPQNLDTSFDTTHFIKLNSKILRYKSGWISDIRTDDFQLEVSENFYVHTRFHDAAMEMIAKTRLSSNTYLYSCINFILLKEIAEVISGVPLDQFLDTTFFKPMNLQRIGYLPLKKHAKDEIAPTLKKDFLRNGSIQGFVHDPDAALMGGVSGNAGLFATAHDVAQVYLMVLNNGELNGERYLSTETCQLFTTVTSKSGRRGLGFDKPVPSEPAHNPCSKLAPQSVYGHTGYTGTCCWVDPDNKLIFVFLSNRTYPNDGENRLATMKIRPKIHNVIYKALGGE